MKLHWLFAVLIVAASFVVPSSADAGGFGRGLTGCSLGRNVIVSRGGFLPQRNVVVVNRGFGSRGLLFNRGFVGRGLIGGGFGLTRDLLIARELNRGNLGSALLLNRGIGGCGF